MMGLAAYVQIQREAWRAAVLANGPGSPGDWTRRRIAWLLFGLHFIGTRQGWTESTPEERADMRIPPWPPLTSERLQEVAMRREQLAAQVRTGHGWARAWATMEETA